MSKFSNIKHRGYANKEQRNNGLQRAKEELKESVLVADTKEIGCKFSLLGCYSAQRDKLKNLKKSGSRTDEVKTIKWTFFDKLAFLNDNLQPRQTISDIFNVDGCNPESPASSIVTSEIQLLWKLPKARCTRQAQESEHFQEKEFKLQATEYLKQMAKPRPEKVKTEDYYFCDMLVKKLRRMAEWLQKEYFQLEIYQLVVKCMLPQCWAIAFLILFPMLINQIDFPHQH